MEIEIQETFNATEKQQIVKDILGDLLDWFGLPESTSEYIDLCRDKLFYKATIENKPVGFLYLKQLSKDTIEIYAMAVKKDYHRQGIGSALFLKAKQKAIELGYSFMEVKTVQIGHNRNYDCTNKFYLTLGFKESELLPHLWDEWNPCQVYILQLS